MRLDLCCDVVGLDSEFLLEKAIWVQNKAFQLEMNNNIHYLDNHYV